MGYCNYQVNDIKILLNHNVITLRMLGYNGLNRCWGNNDPIMRDYHDKEWGVPLHDENKLFELIVLEGAQAPRQPSRSGIPGAARGSPIVGPALPPR